MPAGYEPHGSPGGRPTLSTPSPKSSYSDPEPSSGERTEGLLAGIAGLRRPVLVTAGVGMGLGSLSLLMVAFAEQYAQLAAVAWVEAALAAGSAVGGLAYGAVSWRLSLERRLPLLATALALSMAAAGFAPNIVVLSLRTRVFETRGCRERGALPASPRWAYLSVNARVVVCSTLLPPASHASALRLTAPLVLASSG